MPVPPIKPTAIAVYVYRHTPALEFLQIHRSARANGHQHSWQTVYGGIEPGETAIQAALRELSEETNLTPIRMFQVEYLEQFYFRPNDSLLLMPVVAVEISPTATPQLNHEHDNFRWIPEQEIPTAFMWRTQREALSILLDMLRNNSAATRFLTIIPPPE